MRGKKWKPVKLDIVVVVEQDLIPFMDRRFIVAEGVGFFIPEK